MTSLSKSTHFAANARREARRLHLQQRIIEGAEGLFGRFGYHKTTVDEIARAAGMSKATLYKVIRCKADALTLVIRHEGNLMFTRIRAALGGEVRAPDKLKALALELTRDVKRQFVLRDMSRQAFEELEPHMQKEIRWLVDELAVLIRSILREGLEQGDFRNLDPDAVALAMALGLKEVVMHWNVEMTRLDMEHVVGQLLDLMLLGLLRRD